MAEAANRAEFLRDESAYVEGFRLSQDERVMLAQRD
ncbi:MAG: hypothetical protein HOI95_25040 [Chromatiales bacterium]|nr:hypothetical protein [Chromatiales bacterium]